MNKLFQSPVFTFLLIIFVGFMLIKIIKIDPERADLSRKEINLSERIQKEEETIKEREKNAEYYKSEDYKEIQARLKLNYKKEGENVIFVYDSPVDIEKQASKSEEVLPFWKNWLEYLFGE